MHYELVEAEFNNFHTLRNVTNLPNFQHQSRVPICENRPILSTASITTSFIFTSSSTTTSVLSSLKLIYEEESLAPLIWKCGLFRKSDIFTCSWWRKPLNNYYVFNWRHTPLNKDSLCWAIYIENVTREKSPSDLANIRITKVSLFVFLSAIGLFQSRAELRCPQPILVLFIWDVFHTS